MPAVTGRRLRPPLRGRLQPRAVRRGGEHPRRRAHARRPRARASADPPPVAHAHGEGRRSSARARPASPAPTTSRASATRSTVFEAERRAGRPRCATASPSTGCRARCWCARSSASARRASTLAAARAWAATSAWKDLSRATTPSSSRPARRARRPLDLPGASDVAGVRAGARVPARGGPAQPADRSGGAWWCVGGGDTAIDCARTALRLGGRGDGASTTAPRDELGGHAEAVEEAIREGVRFEFDAPAGRGAHVGRSARRLGGARGDPADVRSRATARRQGAPRGRRVRAHGAPAARRRGRAAAPVPGSEFFLPADTLLDRAGRGADLDFLPAELAHRAACSRWTTFGRTSRAGLLRRRRHDRRAAHRGARARLGQARGDRHRPPPARQGRRDGRRTSTRRRCATAARATSA